MSRGIWSAAYCLMRVYNIPLPGRENRRTALYLTQHYSMVCLMDFFWLSILDRTIMRRTTDRRSGSRGASARPVRIRPIFIFPNSNSFSPGKGPYFRRALWGEEIKSIQNIVYKEISHYICHYAFHIISDSCGGLNRFRWRWSRVRFLTLLIWP